MQTVRAYQKTVKKKRKTGTGERMGRKKHGEFTCWPNIERAVGTTPPAESFERLALASDRTEACVFRVARWKGPTREGNSHLHGYPRQHRVTRMHVTKYRGPRHVLSLSLLMAG